MFKRIISVFFVCVFVSQLFNIVPITVSAINSTQILVDDHFDSSVLNTSQWNIDSALSTASAKTEDGNSCIQLSAPAGTNGTFLAKSFGESYTYTGGYTFIEFKAKMVANSGPFRVYFRNSSPEINQWLTLGSITNTNLVDNKGVIVAPIKIGEWNDFKYVLSVKGDSSTGYKASYCIFLNGEKVSQMMPLDKVDGGSADLNPFFFNAQNIIRFAADPPRADNTIVIIDYISIYKSFDFEEVNVNMPAMGRIYNPGDVNFDVEIIHNDSRNEAKYVVETLAINKVTKQEHKGTPVSVTAPFGKAVNTNIKLRNIRDNGVYDLIVTVKKGSEIIQETKQDFSVFPEYTQQFMDKYGTFGINAHLGWEYDKSINHYNTMLNIAKRTGFTMIRCGLTWSGSTDREGKFLDDKIRAIVQPVLDAGLTPFCVMHANHPAYLSEEEVAMGYNYKMLPSRKENIDSFLEYVRRFMDVLPGVRLFEFWNEPDHPGEWKEEPYPIELAYATKETSLAIKEKNPDAKIISQTMGKRLSGDFTTVLFNQGVMNYVDAYSQHLYLFAQDPQQKYMDLVQSNGNDLIEEQGGWKDIYMSETGYTLVKGTMGVSEEEQANYMVKVYLMLDSDGHKNTMYYDLKNDGTDPNNSEHNFGLTYNDYSAKPALISISYLNRMLQGARFIGQLPLENGVINYLYSRGGEPVLVAWAKEGETQTVDFGVNINADDLYGNPYQSGEAVKVDSRPTYVKNLPKSTFTVAAGNTINKAYGDWLKKWGAKISTLNSNEIADRINNLFDFSGSLLTKETTEAEVLAKLNENYEIGKIIMSEYYGGGWDVSQINAMLMISELHDIGEKWGGLMSVLVAPQSGPIQISSDKALAAVKSKVDKMVEQAHGGSFRYTDDMLYKGRELNKIIEEIKDSTSSYRAGIIKSYDAVALNLAAWADIMQGNEKLYEAHNVLLQTTPTKIRMFGADDSKDVKITLTNYKDIPISGALVITDDKGEIIGDRQNITIDSKATKIANVKVSPKDVASGQALSYYVKLIKDGEDFIVQELPISVYSKLEGSIVPVSATIDKLNEIKLNFNTLGQEIVEGELTVTSPDGFKISNSVQKLTVNPGKTQQISLRVAGVRQNAFNNYVFGVVVKDKNGKEIFNQNFPLSFSVTVKAEETLDPKDFDGNMEMFKDAYPIFVNSPANPRTEQEWADSNCSARTYTKWDENYFYVLADVYDNVHHVITKGFESYNADGIQLSFDTTNSKSNTKYDGDDYEYTLTLHSSGPQAYAHYAAEGKQVGERSSDWVQAIRDNVNNITRYYARIPKSELEPMTLIQGDKFGFNICVNDADVTYRDNFHEFSPGTGVRKDPSVYCVWTLEPSEKNSADIGRAGTYLRVSLDENAGMTMFEDVDGHWAVNEILDMAGMGIIKGVDDTHFEPERDITRVEFLALAVRAISLDPVKYAASYSDVTGDDWYASMVQAAYNAKIIDEGMIKNNQFMPNEPITREEMAAIAVAAYKLGNDINSDKDMIEFYDKDEIAVWAQPYIKAATELGIINGVSENLFAPNEHATRAQAAVIVSRMLK